MSNHTNPQVTFASCAGQNEVSYVRRADIEDHAAPRINGDLVVEIPCQSVDCPSKS